MSELKLVENEELQVQPEKQQVLTVTSVDDVIKYTGGRVVELPEFGEGEPFIAKLRRPSMLKLMKTGVIPNSLMSKAQELFQNGSNFDTSDEDSMSSMFEIMEIIAEQTLVTPSYEQIKNAGGELTDEQLLAIFSYSQQGVKALENFR